MLFFLLWVGLTLASGCVGDTGKTESPRDVKAEIETPIDAPIQTQPPLQPKGPNPFLTGPPVVRDCLRQKLGPEAFEALAAEERIPNPEEVALI